MKNWTALGKFHSFPKRNPKQSTYPSTGGGGVFSKRERGMLFSRKYTPLMYSPNRSKTPVSGAKLGFFSYHVVIEEKINFTIWDLTLNSF